MSQNPRKENPKKSPKLPPISAMKVCVEYNNFSSSIFKKVLEKPKVNPTDLYSPSSNPLTF